jgi:hypothetical protein
MENENTKKAAAQEKADEKESGFACCADCCEGMPISEEMKKKMMSGFKDMSGPSGMAKMFQGCCGSRKSEKA